MALHSSQDPAPGSGRRPPSRSPNISHMSSVNGFASPAMDLDLDLDAATATATTMAASAAPLDSQTTHSPSASATTGQRPKKSSSTCSTCRLRKVRCNGSRPVCSNCQRLGFPCSYDDFDIDSWSMALPRRRVKQACLSCHSRKARCSGHEPACDRCRAQGIECVYRPGKRTAKRPGRSSYSEIRSPRSHDGGDGRDRMRDDRDHDKADDSDTPLTDLEHSPSTFTHDMYVVCSWFGTPFRLTRLQPWHRRVL